MAYKIKIKNPNKSVYTIDANNKEQALHFFEEQELIVNHVKEGDNFDVKPEQKKKIFLTIEEDDAFDGRYMIISQVEGYPKWAESIKGDSGGSSFSSRKEASKYIAEIKKGIEKTNPDAEVIVK